TGTSCRWSSIPTRGRSTVSCRTATGACRPGPTAACRKVRRSDASASRVTGEVLGFGRGTTRFRGTDSPTLELALQAQLLLGGGSVAAALALGGAALLGAGVGVALRLVVRLGAAALRAAWLARLASVARLSARRRRGVEIGRAHV